MCLLQSANLPILPIWKKVYLVHRVIFLHSKNGLNLKRLYDSVLRLCLVQNPCQHLSNIKIVFIIINQLSTKIT